MEKVGQIKFQGRVLDVYDSLEDPLFLAVDIARMIDYSVGNTSHMLDIVARDEKVLVMFNRSNSTNEQTEESGSMFNRRNSASEQTEESESMFNHDNTVNERNRGWNRPKWFLTEDGLYEVLMQSRKPIAKSFKLAVKHELRRIRKEGRGFGSEEFDDLADLLLERDINKWYDLNTGDWKDGYWKKEAL